MAMERIRQQQLLPLVMEFCCKCKLRMVWLLKCHCCGEPVLNTKNRRFQAPHLCKCCYGESKADYMPTIKEIEAEKAAIRAEGINHIDTPIRENRADFQPRVYREYIPHRRGKVVQ